MKDFNQLLNTEVDIYRNHGGPDDSLLPFVAAVPYFKLGHISLQFNGWELVLSDDGTWHWADTCGG